MLTPEQRAAVRHAYTDSLRVEMIVCSAVLGAAFLSAFAVYRKNRLTVDEQQRQRYIEEAQYQNAAQQGRGPEV